MAVSGTINVSASFLDSVSETANESEKKISLASATTITGGKVAVVSGTVGTAAISYGPPEESGFLGGYRDASGDSVYIRNLTGFAFKADGLAYARQEGAGIHALVSDENEVTYTRVERSDDNENFTVAKIGSGTCNFSLMIYGT
tara:strand:+ start:61 stop:492 length:432 start_codon:yes stop_codon:yes gene_type:complete